MKLREVWGVDTIRVQLLKTSDQETNSASGQVRGRLPCPKSRALRKTATEGSSGAAPARGWHSVCRAPRGRNYCQPRFCVQWGYTLEHNMSPETSESMLQETPKKYQPERKFCQTEAQVDKKEGRMPGSLWVKWKDGMLCSLVFDT